MRLHHYLGILAAVGALCGSVTARGAGTVITNNPELILSLGTTAHLVEIDADLGGVPQTSVEFPRGELVPIEPNKLALSFVQNQVSFQNLKRTLILTEDGVWAMAPLVSQNGGPYFLREPQILNIVKKSGPGMLAIVRVPIALPEQGVSFTRGELVRKINEGGRTSILLLSDDPITKDKYAQVSKIRSGWDEGHTGRVILSLPPDQVDKVGGAQRRQDSGDLRQKRGGQRTRLLV